MRAHAPPSRLPQRAGGHACTPLTGLGEWWGATGTALWAGMMCWAGMCFGDARGQCGLCLMPAVTASKVEVAVQLWFYGAKRCPCCEQQFSAWRGWLQGSFSKGGRGSSGWKESKKPDPPHRAERSFISVGSSLRGSSQIIYFGPNEKHVSSAESHNQRKMLRVHAGSCLGHAAPHSAGWGQGDTLPAGYGAVTLAASMGYLASPHRW